MWDRLAELEELARLHEIALPDIPAPADRIIALADLLGIPREVAVDWRTPLR